MSTVNGFCERCNSFRKRYCNGDRNTCLRILFDRIEVLQQENDVIKDSFTTAQKAIGSLQQENEQLLQKAQQLEQIQAQLDSLRCTSCGEIPTIVSTDDDQLCEKCAVELDAIETINLMTYHNPADIDVLEKARALLTRSYDEIEHYKCKLKSIRAGGCDCPQPTILQNDIDDFIYEIDKVLGGKEDV